MVFGQWLSGLARFGAGSPTSPAREKARQLFSEWVKLGLLNYEHIFEMPVHDPHYSFEKLLGGLVDLYCYGGVAEAVPALEGLVAWGLAMLGRERRPADPSGDLACGKPVEWYTLSENSYRAYEATGIDEFRSFGDLCAMSRTGGSSRIAPIPRALRVCMLTVTEHLQRSGYAISTYR